MVGDNRHQSKLRGRKKAEIFYSSVISVKWNVGGVMNSWNFNFKDWLVIVDTNQSYRSSEKLVIVGTNRSWEADGRGNYLKLVWSGTLEKLWIVESSTLKICWW